MSREGAGAKRQAQPPAAGTPIWVWVIYAFGIFAAAVFAFSILFTAGAYILSNDVPVTFVASTRAIVLWGAVVVAAGALWIARRRRK